MRKRVEELRALYTEASLAQRYAIALQRLEYHNSGPNLLIQHVSAVEGFARSVALDLAVKTGESLDKAYARLRDIGPVPLIREHVARRLEREPEDIFGADDWELFEISVKYRNLLIHEATYLRGGFTKELIPVCRKVLEKLAEIAGVRV